MLIVRFIDLFDTKTEIEKIINNPETTEPHFALDCSVIRVGSYGLTHDNDDWKEELFRTNFTAKGILFKLLHSESSKFSHMNTLPILL